MIDSYVLHYNPDGPSVTVSLKNVIASPLFPDFFESIFKFLGRFLSLPSWKDKAELVQQHMGSIVSLPIAGFQIILRFLLELFQKEETLCESIKLADSLAMKLKRKLSQQLLLGPIMCLYEVCFTFTPHSHNSIRITSNCFVNWLAFASCKKPSCASLDCKSSLRVSCRICWPQSAQRIPKLLQWLPRPPPNLRMLPSSPRH